jgi:predicted MFS family arabinose efflux permease
MGGSRDQRQTLDGVTGERKPHTASGMWWIGRLAKIDWCPLGKARITALLTLTLWLNWSSTFYLLTVLGKPIAQDTGWPLTLVITGLSIGLVVAGLISPVIGRVVERHGGRSVLAAGSFILAMGMMWLGLARSPFGYIVAWIVLGVGMAASLYEAAFAALSRFYGSEAKSVISNLMLTVAFAVALSWPFTVLLQNAFGWRGACLCYAGMHLLFGLPMHALLLPRSGKLSIPAPARSADRGDSVPSALPETRAPGAFVWLVGANFTIQIFIQSVVTVHLLALLQGVGVAYDAAVGFGSMIWLAQGGGRLAEAWLGRRFHPVWEGMVASVLVVGGLALVLTAHGTAVVFGLVLFGVGNGIRMIVKGTLPLVLFGAESYAVLIGRLGLPTFVALAAGPALGTIALAHWGPLLTILLLTALAVANLGLSYSLRWALPRRHSVSRAVPPF